MVIPDVLWVNPALTITNIPCGYQIIGYSKYLLVWFFKPINIWTFLFIEIKLSIVEICDNSLLSINKLKLQVRRTEDLPV